MKLNLKVVAGPDVGTEFGLEDGTSRVVGRGEQSDTRVNDRSVSRVHFKIENREGEIFLADQGSSSGTFVNGEKFEQGVVTPECIIQAGDTQFRIDPAPTEDQTIAPNRPTTIDLKPLPELVGETFGPYELLEVIGKGQTGMVFKARDESKNREAAVKILAPQYASNEEQRQRFVRAMKTMLQVKNDRIIRLYNAGIKGPYCWAAMELVEGVNLAQLIERTGIEGMLDWKKVWQVAVDICLALQAGYENKIIHRNVIPTNILRRDSDQVCLLGDFMLTKALEGSLAQNLTQPGQLLGAVAYMAPERTMADAVVDTRSDIYGLGATCYALLTGQPPATGGSTAEIVQCVREKIPEKPKKFQLSINENFQDVVLKMLAKDPADRFQTPSDLLKELARIGKFNNMPLPL